MQIVTLATDLGSNDYLLAALKGQLLSINSSWNVVDITHQLSPKHFLQNSYKCKNAIQYFPQNTIHIVLNNIYQHECKFVVFIENNQFVICADSDLLPLMVSEKSVIKYIDIDVKGNSFLQITKMLFDKAVHPIAQLHSINQFEDYDIKKLNRFTFNEQAEGNQYDLKILYIDRFENIVMDITRSEFETLRKGRKFRIYIRKQVWIETIHNSYNEVSPSSPIAIFNSANYLELAVNDGNMAGLFGLKVDKEQKIASEVKQSDNFFYNNTYVEFFDD